MTAKSAGRVAAVILAAGQSARMGEPKQLLRVGDTTILERTLENVRGTAVDEIVLVLGFATDKIRHQIPARLLDDVTVVVNENFGQGMATSLRMGLSAVRVRASAALIVLADQPFVRPATIDRIVEHYRSSGEEIIIPCYKGQRGNPVLLDRAIFAEAMALEGDTGCRAIFANHPAGVLEVDVDDQGVVLDIDSRDEYERLCGLRGKARKGHRPRTDG